MLILSSHAVSNPADPCRVFWAYTPFSRPPIYLAIVWKHGVIQELMKVRKSRIVGRRELSRSDR